MIFKNFFNKYIGKTQYDVTVTNVSGLVDSYLVSSKKDLVILVEEINTSSYWSVSKIEKSRKLKFKYDGSIKHQALHFGLEGVTEDHDIDGNSLSFLKIDSSLTNVKRTFS